MRVVRYETLVADPEPALARMLDWLGLARDPAILAGVDGSRSGAGRRLVFDPDIAADCDALTAELEAATAKST